MKKVILAIGLLFAIGLFGQSAQAQSLSKKEKKEWKKKLKSLTPEAYKQLTEDYAALKSKITDLDNQVDDLEGQLSDKSSELARKNNRISDLEDQLSSASASSSSTGSSKSGSKVDMNGIVFKVQIGAFRKKDLSKYFDNNENFGGEYGDDGEQKITLGVFRDYWEANTFKKYLREMGVKDAWIVSYKDGKRVPIKDVLEGVMK